MSVSSSNPAQLRYGGRPLLWGTLGLLLAIYGTTPMAATTLNDPCTDDYRRIILDDKAYPGAEAKISAMEKIAGRCAKTTGQYEFRLASLFTELERFDRSEALLKQGMALGKGYKRELRLAMADLSLSRGDLPGAERQYKDLVQENPNWFFGYTKLGVVRMEQRRFREAAEFLEKANALEKNAFTYRSLAIVYNQLGEHEAAVRSINIAFEMDDESIVGDRDAMLSAIHSYGALGKLEVARNLIGMTLNAQPDFRNDPRYQQALNYLKKREEEVKGAKK